MRAAVVACGALAIHIKAIAARRGWDVDVHPIPPELHNRPERIAPAADVVLDDLQARYDRVVIGYGDCGSRGAVDELCRRRGLARLEGDTCYDMFGAREVAEARAAEPGTFFLTDFLVRGFDHLVWRGLGMERHPELRDDYFGNYAQVVWLAQDHSPELEARARAASERLGLPLVVRDVGESGLEAALAAALAE
jgi:hypothetical protein